MVKMRPEINLCASMMNAKQIKKQIENQNKNVKTKIIGNKFENSAYKIYTYVRWIWRFFQPLVRMNHKNNIYKFRDVTGDATHALKCVYFLFLRKVPIAFKLLKIESWNVLENIIVLNRLSKNSNFGAIIWLLKILKFQNIVTIGKTANIPGWDAF